MEFPVSEVEVCLENAKLASLSYLEFVQNEEGFWKPKLRILSEEVMTMLDKYDILHHQHDKISGLSYTIFKNKQTKLVTIGISGTDPDEFSDFLGCLDIALGKFSLAQMVALYNDINKHRTPKNKIIFNLNENCQPSFDFAEKHGILSQEKYYDVTGHSQGGHLAQALGVCIPNVRHVYTYNAPHIQYNNPFLLKMAHHHPINIDKTTTNIVANNGLSLISKYCTGCGPVIPIHGYSHRIKYVTQTLNSYVQMGLETVQDIQDYYHNNTYFRFIKDKNKLHSQSNGIKSFIFNKGLDFLDCVAVQGRKLCRE